tara:strand:- start:4057 stop:4965 length:909 start_codon:yes stop_codon:yes gene_type:complete
MKLLIFFLVGLLLFCGAAYWLGWGQRTSWEESTGWSRLSDVELELPVESARVFEAIGSAPRLSWWGHATVRIDWMGLRVLVDPVASSRIKVAPRRFAQPQLNVDTVCDVILITHAHMDHLDVATLEKLAPARLLLPAGSERFLSDAVLSRHVVQPVALGEVIKVGGLEMIPVPARHGGWRYPWQRGLFACGYIFRAEGEVLYVAGDSAMGPHFKEIGQRYAPRTVFLPIGGYAPQWFLQSRHLNPEEALDVAADLGAEFVIPYHFGTYRLSLEAIDEPLLRFASAALAHHQKWFLPVSKVLE